MKKLFTFAAAILASVAMMADVDLSLGASYDFTTITADAFDGLETSNAYWSANSNGYYQNNKYQPTTATAFLLTSTGTEIAGFEGLKCITGSSSGRVRIYTNGNGLYFNSNNAKLVFPGLKAGQVITINYANVSSDEAKFTFTNATEVQDATNHVETLTVTADGDVELTYNSKKFYIKTMTIESAAPVVDPVAEVTIAGPDAVYVGKAAAYAATTDVKADEYKWFVNDVEQEGAETKNFEYTPEAEGTFNIVCKAKNANNTDWVASEAIALVASVKPVLAPVSISEATVWDFSKAASVKEIKWEGDQKDAAPVLLANVDGMNNNEDFNSQALLFSGEYPIRDGKYCQGPLLKFNTTVAGYLTIEYSNTGNRSAAEGETAGQEALRRFLAINGALVEGDEGTMKSNINTITNNIPVAAGDVEISARMPYRTDEKDVNSPEYIRIYKVQFTLEAIPTAIENAEEAVKAVKFFQNGQLMIEKNGVIYNAQGAIVK